MERASTRAARRIALSWQNFTLVESDFGDGTRHDGAQPSSWNRENSGRHHHGRKASCRSDALLARSILIHESLTLSAGQADTFLYSEAFLSL